MDDITENNVVALLEKCYTNGENGPGSLWLWFLNERNLIEQTLQEVGVYIEEKEELKEYNFEEPEDGWN